MSTASAPETITFRNQQLFLTSKWETLVIQAWPKPGAWIYRDKRDVWKPCSLSTSNHYSFQRYDKDLDGTNKVESRRALNITVTRPLGYTPSWNIPLKDKDRTSTRPFFDFIQQIPKELRVLLARYDLGHWDMLRLAAQNPAFVDLIRINPALAYCLSAHTAFRKETANEPLREAARMVGRKQREILSWLGFPETEKAVRILRKIPSCACSVDDMMLMRHYLNSPVVPKLLSHVARINPGCLPVFDRVRSLPRTTEVFRRQVISWTPYEEFQLVLSRLKRITRLQVIAENFNARWVKLFCQIAN